MDYAVVHHGQRTEGVGGLGAWAAAREAEGWSLLAAADHLHAAGNGWLHPYVTLGAMAAVTTRIGLTTAYTNNLLRSPVDVAQASLTLHHMTNGRFEVGMGAGWQQDEIVGAGLEYPAPPTRARRFREAVLIVRDLLSGGCQFAGDFYRIDLPAAGPAVDPAPRLAAALGGPWTLRHIGPLVDHFELFPAGPIARHGTADFAQLAHVTDNDVWRLIDQARTANPHASIGLSVFPAAGNGPVVDYFAASFQGGFMDGLGGAGDQVVDAVRRLDRFGVDRVTVVAPVPGTVELIAPQLFAH